MGSHTSRRRTPRILVLCAAFCLIAVCIAARADDWPERAVTLVVPFAPGSTPDIVARLLADKLRPRLGQPVIVDNRPGAGGNIGTAAVARAAPDGYTVGISITGPLVNNKLLYRRMTYDPFTDFAPITQLVTQPSVLVATADLGVDDVASLLALLERHPDKYNYASLGNGSLSHLAMELLASRTGSRLLHVPYSGSPQAIQALLRGDAHVAALPPGPVMPHVKSGKLKALAVTMPARFPLLPDIPTFRESGIPDVEATAWQGAVAPAGTPAVIVERLHREIAGILRLPEVASALRAQYMEPVGSRPEEFAAFMRAELARWEPIVRRRQIVLD